MDDPRRDRSHPRRRETRSPGAHRSPDACRLSAELEWATMAPMIIEQAPERDPRGTREDRRRPHLQRLPRRGAARARPRPARDRASATRSRSRILAIEPRTTSFRRARRARRRGRPAQRRGSGRGDDRPRPGGHRRRPARSTTRTRAGRTHSPGRCRRSSTARSIPASGTHGGMVTLVDVRDGTAYPAVRRWLPGLRGGGRHAQAGRRDRDPQRGPVDLGDRRRHRSRGRRQTPTTSTRTDFDARRRETEGCGSRGQSRPRVVAS